MQDIDIDIATLKRRSIVGILSLTTQTFLLQIIAFVATFLLTLLLSPSVFGVYYVVSAIISFLGYFSDIGLAAALVQKKEALTDADLTTTFTIQQGLVVSIIIIALLGSSFIAQFYHLDQTGLWLFRALVISFFLSSLKTIPHIMLERELQFNKLVIPTIIETLSFYLVTVYLAWRGFGIVSFTWGVLVQGLSGLIAIYIIRPWRMSFGFSKEVLHKLLRFGIPFQMNSFMALLKDDLFTVFLGKVLPFAQVGYIGWAKKWAEVPLRLIMDSIIRVTFPAFSRLQHDVTLLKKAIETTVYGLAVTILPISMGLLFFIKPMVDIIPKYNKWEPALFSFYFFVVGSAIAGLTTPLTNAFNAIGRIKKTLTFMVVWTTLTWILAVTGLKLFGFNGVAIALSFISLTIVWVLYELKKIVAFSFMKQVRSAVAGIAVQGVWYALLLPRVAHTIPLLVCVGLVGVILYAGVVYVLDRVRIQEFIGSMRNLP